MAGFGMVRNVPADLEIQQRQTSVYSGAGKFFLVIEVPAKGQDCGIRSVGMWGFSGRG